MSGVLPKKPNTTFQAHWTRAACLQWWPPLNNCLCVQGREVRMATNIPARTVIKEEGAFKNTERAVSTANAVVANAIVQLMLIVITLLPFCCPQERPMLRSSHIFHHSFSLSADKEMLIIKNLSIFPFYIWGDEVIKVICLSSLEAAEEGISTQAVWLQNLIVHSFLLIQLHHALTLRSKQ